MLFFWERGGALSQMMSMLNHHPPLLSLLPPPPPTKGTAAAMRVLVTLSTGERLRCDAALWCGSRPGTTLRLCGVSWLAPGACDTDPADAGVVTHCARNHCVEAKDVAACEIRTLSPPAWEPEHGFPPEFFLTVVVGDARGWDLPSVLFAGGPGVRLAVAARAVLLRERYPRSGLRLARCLLRGMPWTPVRRTLLHSAKLRVLLPLVPPRTLEQLVRRTTGGGGDGLAYLDWVRFRFPPPAAIAVSDGVAKEAKERPRRLRWCIKKEKAVEGDGK